VLFLVFIRSADPDVQPCLLVTGNTSCSTYFIRQMHALAASLEAQLEGYGVFDGKKLTMIVPYPGCVTTSAL
jgi:hypothetical protein